MWPKYKFDKQIIYVLNPSTHVCIQEKHECDCTNCTCRDLASMLYMGRPWLTSMRVTFTQPLRPPELTMATLHSCSSPGN